MKLIPHFTFNGQAKSALSFYVKVLNGNITNLMYYRDAPHLPGKSEPDEQYSDRVMCSVLEFNGHCIHICDQLPRETVVTGNSIMIDIIQPDESEIKRIFSTISENGTIIIPLAPTDWTANYGLVTDQFGISWNLMQNN